jgi:hypothetical protein
VGNGARETLEIAKHERAAAVPPVGAPDGVEEALELSRILVGRVQELRRVALGRVTHARLQQALESVYRAACNKTITAPGVAPLLPRVC